MRDLVDSVIRSVSELKGFQRVELDTGEPKQVSFVLTEETLAFARADGTKGVESGQFQVWVAPNSTLGLSGEYRL